MEDLAGCAGWPLLDGRTDVDSRLSHFESASVTNLRAAELVVSPSKSMSRDEVGMTKDVVEESRD